MYADYRVPDVTSYLYTRPPFSGGETVRGKAHRWRWRSGRSFLNSTPTHTVTDTVHIQGEGRTTAAQPGRRKRRKEAEPLAGALLVGAAPSPALPGKCNTCGHCVRGAAGADLYPITSEGAGAGARDLLSAFPTADSSPCSLTGAPFFSVATGAIPLV